MNNLELTSPTHALTLPKNVMSFLEAQRDASFGPVGDRFTVRGSREKPSDAIIMSARAVLSHAESGFSALPDRERLRLCVRLLAKLNGAVSKPLRAPHGDFCPNEPTRNLSEFQMRAKLLFDALGEMPLAAEHIWPEVERDALRAFKFMPAVAEVVTLVERKIDLAKARLHAIRRIAKMKLASDERREADERHRLWEEEFERRSALRAASASSCEA